ncbi:acetoacetate--CoA ligase [Streptomyces sp. NPDC088768]|uniref:acetoacetate--CoA ligase n=1 Tax=Streptomyces sp. NPDC088768 TaxID=3365894 RepID=UPI00381AA9E6
MSTTPAPFWSPDPHVAAESRIAAFARHAAASHGAPLPDASDYAALHRWSVADAEGFWGAVWEYFGIRAETPYERVLGADAMPGAEWFPGARLNYARHLLDALDPERTAIVALDETGAARELSGAGLRARVGALAATLRALGVGEGDRVVAYLPHTEHAVIGLLASASLGAVWSVCGQDYAPKAAADRFAQLEPVVLLAADGYRFNGTAHDRREATARLAAALPTLKAVVRVDHLGLDGDGPALPVPAVAWDEAVSGPGIAPVPVAFDHPLWIVFSSGTTGLPKGIVHGHGGVLVEHLKTLGLHCDLGPGERLLWYTTTHWMMWNLVVSALLTGASICVYDGSPVPAARPDMLWELAARHGVTFFGTSPQYLLGMEKLGIEPGAAHDLSGVRGIGCTGSTLPASAYPWVRDHVGAHVQLVSTSGGTDIVSGFAGGAPTTPVWAGELSVPNLGVALAAYDPEGNAVVDRVGELVVTRPLPSMPLYFWNDPEGERHRAAYFGVYPGVWRHGDWITLTSHGSVVVHGRSDATLNRNGVRLGSADIHDVVERLPEIAEALVIGAEEEDGGYWMPLFVRLAPGAVLDDALRGRIRDAIREGASPRHVPDEVIEVPGVPHTRTGKKLEVPVKRLLQGADLATTVNPMTVDAPQLLEFFARLGEERREVRRRAGGAS